MKKTQVGFISKKINDLCIKEWKCNGKAEGEITVLHHVVIYNHFEILMFRTKVHAFSAFAL